MTSPHETVARARKVLALIEALEAQKGAHNVPALDMAKALRSMSPHWWRKLAESASVREPSQLTRDALIGHYERIAAIKAFGSAAAAWPEKASGKTTLLTEDPYPEAR